VKRSIAAALVGAAITLTVVGGGAPAGAKRTQCPRVTEAQRRELKAQRAALEAQIHALVTAPVDPVVQPATPPRIVPAPVDPVAQPVTPPRIVFPLYRCPTGPVPR
jgi:hypothetical protein